jgi:hypothetical protein
LKSDGRPGEFAESVGDDSTRTEQVRDAVLVLAGKCNRLIIEDLRLSFRLALSSDEPVSPENSCVPPGDDGFCSSIRNSRRNVRVY